MTIAELKSKILFMPDHFTVVLGGVTDQFPLLLAAVRVVEPTPVNADGYVVLKGRRTV